MGTWCGMTTGLVIYCSKKSLTAETYSKLLRAYLTYFGITRFMWMNGYGRFARPGLPRRLQEMLLFSFTGACLRWHKPAEKQVVAWTGEKGGEKKLSEKQIIFLNEPHGVGNGILSLLYFVLKERSKHLGQTEHASPVILGSKNVCLVPFLAEFCWLLAGSSGFEFAENVSDIKLALRSNRDITLVPSGFSTIGTGGRVDWSRRKRFFQLVIDHAEEEGKVINLLPVVWLYELGSYTWFTSKSKFVERLRVKLRAPIGGIAYGYSPFLFWLPSRGPQLLGVGFPGLDISGGEDVGLLKEKLKCKFDDTFKIAKEEWNNIAKGTRYLRQIQDEEWDFKVV
ncbi:hypothetical protein TrCOL_g8249 [Triparma columacea]|uniref:Acyltransferase n=1 Tax=Triparma columacea TaxID=722753 RepID=A0A9W7G6D0_9STRA|nr:hypothetical protein TrCOL_g8249 [Triparma columacea]